MRLAISNIAWDISENEVVAQLLHKYRINAIDVAPSKFFPEPEKARDAEIIRIRNWWGARGIEITGMQSLLFGTTGLNVFGSNESQQSLLDYLSAVFRIGAGLGATRLVFGSPKNRDRSGLNDQETLDTAVSFFHRLGDMAQTYNAIICLEPNPSCYGANFMTTSLETAEVVKSIAHPAIKMQFDTGALTINGENAELVLAANSQLIGHIHASEPHLMPLGDGPTEHCVIHDALCKYLPHHIVSIEMTATKDEPHLTSIERALKVATKNYRCLDGVDI